MTDWYKHADYLEALAKDLRRRWAQRLPEDLEEGQYIRHPVHGTGVFIRSEVNGYATVSLPYAPSVKVKQAELQPCDSTGRILGGYNQSNGGS